MDLAQSILKELITLQSKNEELARIITKLEHESDIIIKQFESKIEELQKSLKHEQDDKSRASRRYDAEIRGLEESRDALIHEISEVRDTFKNRENQFEEKTQSLNITLDEKEKQYASLLEEKNGIVTAYEEKITSLQINLEDQVIADRHEQDLLSSQARALEETLKQDRDHYTSLIKQKEEDLHITGEALKAMDQRLHEYAEREKTLKAQSQETIEHLHLLINTERQIRTRELKERDLLEKGLEEQLKSGRQELINLESRLKEETAGVEREVARLQSLFSDESVARQRSEEENRILSDRLSVLKHEYEEKLAGVISGYSLEIESLQDQINRLHEELQSVAASHAQTLRIRDNETASLIRIRDELQVSLREITEAKQLVQDDLTKTILQHEEEKNRFEQVISSVESDKAHLQRRIGELETLGQENNRLVKEIEQEKERSEGVQQKYQREIIRARDELKELGLERDHLLSESRAREDYFRDEISGLHQELADLQASSRSQEETLRSDVMIRDRQIQDLFTSNEALRAEIDRVRHQYITLQEAIRAEKDESVHALYREITTLEEKLAGRDRDIATLSENILRLDAENTKLIQQVTPAEMPTVFTPPLVTSPEPPSPQTLGVSPDHIDPRRKEVLTLASELEDPAQAADAAVKLVAMGHSIVDHLIPLLHTGSIQRRVWIAVVLYEINDNRATLPLMRLLETPKVHFRELIWEAKNQYRSRMRSTPHPGEVVLRPGFMGQGF